MRNRHIFLIFIFHQKKPEESLIHTPQFPQCGCFVVDLTPINQQFILNDAAGYHSLWLQCTNAQQRILFSLLNKNIHFFLLLCTCKQFINPWFSFFFCASYSSNANRDKPIVRVFSFPSLLPSTLSWAKKRENDSCWVISFYFCFRCCCCDFNDSNCIEDTST